jgi:hypothetical protein
MQQNRLALVEIAANEEAFPAFASRSNANSKPNLRPARSAPWKCSVVSDTADVVVRVEVPADVLGAVLAAIDKGKLRAAAR